LKIYINHFTVLVDGSPQVMLFAIDLNGPARRARGIGKEFIKGEKLEAERKVQELEQELEGLKADLEPEEKAA
jgi:hypothetical protein